MIKKHPDLENLDLAFAEFEKSFTKERQEFFNSLTKDQQLLVFCEVVHKLAKAELQDKRSYRGVLYTEFGFDTDAYGKAQISGFLDLHNSIEAEPVSVLDIGRKILKLYGIEQTNEQVEQKLKDYKPDDLELGY